MSDATHKGYTNWETWNVGLRLLSSDKSVSDWLDDLVADAVVNTNDPRGREEALALADILQSEVPRSGVVADSVSWHRVDWMDLAEKFLRDYWDDIEYRLKMDGIERSHHASLGEWT